MARDDDHRQVLVDLRACVAAAIAIFVADFTHQAALP